MRHIALDAPSPVTIAIIRPPIPDQYDHEWIYVVTWENEEGTRGGRPDKEAALERCHEAGVPRDAEWHVDAYGVLTWTRTPE